MSAAELRGDFDYGQLRSDLDGANWTAIEIVRDLRALSPARDLDPDLDRDLDLARDISGIIASILDDCWGEPQITDARHRVPDLERALERVCARARSHADGLAETVGRVLDRTRVLGDILDGARRVDRALAPRATRATKARVRGAASAEHTAERAGPSTSSAAKIRSEQRERSAAPDAHNDDDQADLLFRVYIPSERLYAAEADRLLSLFRDWLITTRARGIRQAGYSTASGKMYEFFADTAVIQPTLRKEFDSFSSFLTLCITDTSAAADMLTPLGLGRVISTEFVARISREVRQLQTDLAHERERRIMIIRHSVEKELVDAGIELRTIPRVGIQTLIESLVPGPFASDSLALLAAPQPLPMTVPVTVNIHPQIVSAVESTVIQNIHGTVQLGPQANQLLELIEQFGGNQRRELESFVYELEDTDAPVAARATAKRSLKTFLGQVGGSVRDVAIDLLEKYIEDKLGI